MSSVFGIRSVAAVAWSDDMFVSDIPWSMRRAHRKQAASKYEALMALVVFLEKE